ncbi:MAG: VOC family protein [Saprospiraceae bacterium]|nr:VOC family protein [Saprospiraceae bacterium]
MIQSLLNISLLVHDYDEAIDFYVNKLNFELIEDTTLSQDKRWVRVRPSGSGGTSILLAKASTAEQIKCVGNQCGGRVFLFLQTDDIHRDLEHFNNHAINIISPLRDEPYGKVLVFTDLYGNKWDLIQPLY